MKNKSRDLLLIAIVVLLSVIAWVTVEIYHIRTTNKYTVDYQKSMNLKIKKLNLETIRQLEKR
jgi:hypothetical protein